jgi:hypothetical protein
VISDEPDDPIGAGYERSCQLGVWCMAHHDQERHFVRFNGRQFVRLVPNPSVVRDRRPTSTCDGLEPFFIAAVLREVVSVAFDS